jgi:hypothetical protein
MKCRTEQPKEPAKNELVRQEKGLLYYDEPKNVVEEKKEDLCVVDSAPRKSRNQNA